MDSRESELAESHQNFRSHQSLARRDHCLKLASVGVRTLRHRKCWEVIFVVWARLNFPLWNFSLVVYACWWGVLALYTPFPRESPKTNLYSQLAAPKPSNFQFLKTVNSTNKNKDLFLIAIIFHAATMVSHKRSRDEVDLYSAFCLPRNVRARLALRNSQPLLPTPSLSPILRKGLRRRHVDAALSSIETSNSKENVPQLSNEFLIEDPVQKAQRTTRIRFHKKVAVHRIPARHHYSDDIKRCIWSDIAEIREMARRNSIEFASEGYDWRRATEDDAMVVLPTGERIHPIWEQRRYFQPIRNTHSRRVPIANV